jgi:hypothetical protein
MKSPSVRLREDQLLFRITSVTHIMRLVIANASSSFVLIH